jgi:Ca2+-binding RTX toxin-like protein
MSRYRRTFTILVSAALTAGLLATAFAAPASAAKPRCAGLKATIVGTAKGEVIRGTAKRDVIVARGGHDKVFGRGGNDVICGGTGHDRIVGAGGKDLIFGGAGRDKLYGGSGRDRLLGGPANDRLAGGPGNDACLQGAGTGLHIGCERPVAKVTPPPPPTLIPLTGILAIAYSDIDGLDGYSTGDVLISQLVDTDRDGVPSEDDTIKMGRYPKDLAASAFGDWNVSTHTVTGVGWSDANYIHAFSASSFHAWYRTGGSDHDQYYEEESGDESQFRDNPGSGEYDLLFTRTSSPSRPHAEIPETEAAGTGDDDFIDVELAW